MLTILVQRYLLGIQQLLQALQAQPKLPKLEGESEPIELKAKGYSIFKKDDKHYIKIESFEVSRKWMDIILNSYVKDEAFEIDGKLAKVLGIVI